MVGYLLHAPSVLFGQKKHFKSSSAEPSGQTRDLYCILNYFSCLVSDPQTLGRGVGGENTMKMPYMTLSTTQSDEHFYSPINICMSGETAK